MIDQTSPAERAFFANLAEWREREAARMATINADPRIIRLRAMKGDRATHPESADELVSDLISGRVSDQARINRLLRARIGQIDKNRAAVQVNLREAKQCRNEHWGLVA